MAKTLTFTYKGTEYTLEFTRRTAGELARTGFKTADLVDYPITAIPNLFAGAFLAHHRFVKRDVVDDIFNHLTQRAELITALAEMYNEPAASMLTDPDEDAEGNVNWTVTA